MSRAQPRSAGGQDGHVLMLALFVLLIVSAAVALAAAASQRELLLRSLGARVHLRALDDAAIAASLAELEHGGHDVAEQPLGGGSIASRISGSGRRRVIETCARLGARRRSSTVTVWVGSSHPRVLDWQPGAPRAGWCD